MTKNDVQQIALADGRFLRFRRSRNRFNGAIRAYKKNYTIFIALHCAMH